MDNAFRKIVEAEFSLQSIIRNPSPLHRFVLSYYRFHGRDLPWRKTEDPYHIFISEVMLQQTQVSRVEERFRLFIDEAPDFPSLASLSTKKLLSIWQGLGYNRRALYLRDAAQVVTEVHGGQLPETPDELVKLKGIGPNTASSICAFAFNKPVVFIETNIRRFYIHYFFKDTEVIEDKAILELAEKTLYRESPRDWYNALMDIGSIIPKTVLNPNRKSSSYKKQSAFKGSLREIRGELLRILQKKDGDIGELRKYSKLLMESDVPRIKKAAETLKAEGFVRETAGRYSIQ